MLYEHFTTYVIDTIVTGIGNASKTFGTLLVMPRPSKLGKIMADLRYFISELSHRTALSW